jgi:hypothetical protein
MQELTGAGVENSSTGHEGEGQHRCIDICIMDYIEEPQCKFTYVDRLSQLLCCYFSLYTCTEIEAMSGSTECFVYCKCTMIQPCDCMWFKHILARNVLEDSMHDCKLLPLLQAVALGTWLRHRYAGTAALLPGEYSAENVIAHSTNYRRTRGTMHGVLLGLYPACTEDFKVTTSMHDDELMLFPVLYPHRH